MRVYTKKLQPSTKELIKNSPFIVRKLLSGGLKAPQGEIFTIGESIKKYNSHLSADQIAAWVWYRKKQGIAMNSWRDYDKKPSKAILHSWVKKGVLFIEGESLVPEVVFTFGNIYTKLTKLKKQEGFISKNYGASVYENHRKILSKATPKTLSISNPIESERPVILAISSFTKEFTVDALQPQTGILLEKPTSLQQAFTHYLKGFSDDQFKGTSAYKIINYYLYGNPKPRSIDKIEWRSITQNSRDQGEHYFKKFLYEALTQKDRQRIDGYYNSTFNAISAPDYNKIPVGVEVSKTFHGFDLDIRPAQREGIAFMELVGSGIIAYDVGVGKTITAIIEVASALKSGKCKRPLVCVPNPTYKNWMKEMLGFGDKKGILSGTGIKLNEWYNLGKGYDSGEIDFEKKIPQNTITLVTYEGFQKLGFSKDATQSHLQELSAILSQTTGKSERDKAKELEKYQSIIGVGQKGTIADIDTLGFDYLVIDEAHNFKNIFSEVKSDAKDAKKRFHIKGGSPSSRGIKAFFICNYIQRTYGRNIMLLTATPFTNSPLEIYSMLSLVAYDYMKQNQIYNIKDFFEQYIQETTEYVVGTDGEIKQKDVVKSFNNRISLQKLINSHINFKTGEEANIPRPCKVNLPKTRAEKNGKIIRLQPDKQITTYLQLTPEQEENQRWINSEASKPVSKEDPGKQLRLMSQSLSNALSPFLFSKEMPEDYLDFVVNSPKIEYTLKCIQSVKQWHEKRDRSISGQVIYIDRGKEYFGYIKEYLEKELGYQKNVQMHSNPKLRVDQVEIISSGISNAKKEKIKNAFNDGSCKIIIGTSTIKEGINLQKKSTVLYNLYPNWNPTDIRQLEGRIWRQKNENAYVRIVMPLMENSMDVFVFQKLEEKTSRINDLWSKSDRGNVLDEESLDPNEIKFALVTDLGVLTRFEIKQIAQEASRKVVILEANIKSLESYNELQESYRSGRKRIQEKLTDYHSRIDNVELFFSNHYKRTLYYGDLKELDHKHFTKTEQVKVQSTEKHITTIKEYLQSEQLGDQELVRAYSAAKRLFASSGYSYDFEFNRFKDTLSKYHKIRRTLFEQRGYKESADISAIKFEMEKELELAKAEKQEVNGEAFYTKIYDRIKSKKESLNLKGGSLQQKVVDFTSLNHLLSYRFIDVDHTSCSIPRGEAPLKQVSKKESHKKDTNVSKRIRIAKAKARAIRIRLSMAS